ncbi:prominin-2 isoform X1 [Erinaceus europaeus]|uniref:Prominin-2 isoform X1 n=1 Tax=Erinaceus europaeus TaxID=9365 RepID=A0A1S3WJY4_ERIEU|nr:prominin-2 isoform X1 [Erinaceus europaeus]
MFWRGERAPSLVSNPKLLRVGLTLVLPPSPASSPAFPEFWAGAQVVQEPKPVWPVLRAAAKDARLTWCSTRNLRLLSGCSCGSRNPLTKLTMPAPGFLAALLGLGLGLLLSLLDVEATGCRSLGPTERLAFAPVAKARWLAPRARAPGPLDPLYGTVRRFLSVVQLNPFPEELVKSLMNEPSSVKVDEVVRYEAGYVVCAVIAGVYLLAVPTAGLCFCCCRRRRRCGGRVKTEHKALACERGALMAFLLLTTLVLLVGMVCTFVTNQRVHEQMGPSVEAVPETLLSLRGLVSDVPRELQLVGQQFALPQNRILEDLDGVGLNIGSAMHTQLRSTVYQALGSVLSLGQALQISVDHLRALNATSVELWQGQKDLEPAVQEHRERLLKLLQEPSCQGCAGALSQARALELGADFSQVPPVDNALHHLKDIPEADFSSMVEEENSTFNALPLLAAMQMADVVKDLKKVVNQQPEGLRTLAEGFPGWETASKWSQTLEEVERSSRPYLKELQRYEKYRWIVGCVLCSVILLVVACNLLGLNLGIWGLSAREDPSHSEAKGEAGACFLMVGVGLSFLFAAPLILLVFATFLVGGNMQTLVCRSWESGDLYKFADTPGNLPSSMNLTQLLDLKENVSIFLAYRQCKEGAVLWKVLQLNDSFDLEKHLDISQYTSKLHQDLQNLKVDMEKLDLLNSASRRDLKALQRSGLENIHYPGFLVQIEKPVVNTELEKLTQELERLTQTQSNSVLREQLQEEAHGLRKLHQQKVLPQQNLVAKLNFSVRTLASSAPNLQLETSGTLNKVDYLKGELLAQANQILRNESECFLDREMGYFSQYMAWVREEVTQRIATCQPLSGALDNGRVILCDMMTDPWNAFWFCLAWCTFFLIPSIIFAVKTSKYFRPIRKRLSSTSSEETQLFHIPRVTSLKL